MITTMRVTDILSLPSIDSEDLSYGAQTVGDLMWSKTEELEEGSDKSSMEEYDAIRNAMRVNGINEIPIHVTYGRDLCPAYHYYECPDELTDSLMMGNGHHRVALAIQLGHEFMQVTDDIYESGW